jgi:hypothetical protein
VYTTSDDCLGFDASCGDPRLGGMGGSNLAVHRLEGVPPHYLATTVSAMPAYGGIGYRDGMDSWKAMGLICVDGVLYMSISQHSSAYDYPDHIQRTYDCSIIKSADHGRTWSAKRRDAMFPSPRFSTPFFVQFGQDNAGAFDDYVYAVSSGCSWNNGNFMTLGRVHRDKIGNLEAEEWEMFGGLEEGGAPKWRPYRVGAWMQDWPAIFSFRGYTSMTGMHWVPGINRFLLPQWAYLDQDGPTPWRQTMLHLYEAPMPWGPWHLVHLEEDFGRAWYNPSLPAKWFEDGGMRMWLVAGGDFAGQRVREGDVSDYALFVRQLELQKA